MSADQPPISSTERDVIRAARNVLATALDAIGPVIAPQAGHAQMTTKSDGTPVTTADLYVDEQLHDRLTASFPDHGIISEERSTVVPDTEWTWIIDPIDGTSNFTNDLPYWCLSIALAFQGVPVLGVIDAPVIRRRYEAITGEGTLRNGKPVNVRQPIDWTDPVHRHIPIMLTMATARHARAAGVRCNVRNMGSAALDMAIVADGTAIASIERIPHIWDLAAGRVIVTQAGGVMFHPDGTELFPLRPGDDHADVATVTITAPTSAVAEGLADALLPADPASPATPRG